MSVSAAAIRKMVMYGLDAGQIADLCEAIEAGSLPDAIVKRREYDRNRKREKRLSGGIPTECPVEMSGGNPVESPPDAASLARVRDNPLKLVLTGKNLSEANASSSGAKSKSVRRCPADWTPSPAVIAVGIAEGFTPGQIDRALAMMRDHEFRTGRTDWDATARNWLRTDKNRKTENGQPAKQSAREANLARAFAGAQDAARRRAEC